MTLNCMNELLVHIPSMIFLPYTWEPSPTPAPYFRLHSSSYKLLITELTCSENTIHIVSRQGWSLQIDTLLKVRDKLLYSIRGNNAWLFDACNTICFKAISEKGCHDLLVYFWTFSTTFVYLPLSPRQQYLEGKGDFLTTQVNYFSTITFIYLLLSSPLPPLPNQCFLKLQKCTDFQQHCLKRKGGGGF